MPDEDTLRGIIGSAVYAPSGDNSQPWEFSVSPGEVRLYNTPHSDGTLFNFRQRGSYVGHGAVLENIALLSREKGLEPRISLFPGGEQCVAAIGFEPAEPAPQPLSAHIQNRSTNRKPYRAEPLSAQAISALLAEAKTDADITLRLFSDRTQVREFASILSFIEQLIMENRQVHDFLFSMIRWSEEEERRRPGLYVKTMELPPPVRFMFKYVLCHMPAVRALNSLGFSKVVSKQTASLYDASGAIGVIVIPDAAEESFVKAGRVLQRAWLAATGLGLSMQPVAAIPYLAQRIRAGEAQSLSPVHRAQIQELDEKIRSLASVDPGQEIAMIFRLGDGGVPSARSAKLPPVFKDRP